MMTKHPRPVPSIYDPHLAAIIVQSKRLKRQSADIMKRIAVLDEKIAERMPVVRSTRAHPKLPSLNNR
jgi:hypothetical protein